MFVPLAAILVLASLLVGLRSGVRHAVALVWWPAVMLPTYCARELGPISFDLPTVAGVTLMLCFLLTQRIGDYRLVLADVLMAAMTLTLVLSELRIGAGLGSTAAIVLRYGLPYVIGRVALSPQSLADDLDVRNTTIRVMGFGFLVTSAAAIIEAVTYANPYWVFSGREMEYLTRFGLRRASGPAEHPIGLGLLFICMLPWALEGRRLSRIGAGARWWRIIPAVALVGIIATGSRGPILALVVLTGVVVYLSNPAWRRTFTTLAAAGVALIGVFSQEAVDVLNHLEDGDSRCKVMVNIDGESYQYTGTNHRFLQVLVYRDLISETGLLGYGSKGMELFTKAASGQAYVRGFPRNVPGTFYSIDSHYLYFVLERGWLNLLLWCGLAITATCYLAAETPRSQRFLRFGLAGVVVSMSVILATVFSHPPFEAPYLFILGLAATWRNRQITRDAVVMAID